MRPAILRCFNDYGEVRVWSPDVDVLEQGAHAKGWNDIDGVFVGSAADWMAVLREGDRLVVARPAEHRLLSTVELVEMVPTSAPGGREARLRFSDGAVWTVEYAVVMPMPDEADPTPFTDPSDFDFGEYLRSLVLDSDRQNQLFGAEHRRVD